MNRVRAIWLGAVVVVTAVGVAACGGSGGGSQASTAPGAANATVSVASSDLGDILVDSSGRTVYLFAKDAGGASSCTGACAAAWPPLAATGAPVAGSGVDAGKLATTTRAGGASQVTYNGHPLYRFSGDAKAGDTKGEGANAFGAQWWALSGGGDPVQKKSGGGYGGY